MYKDAEEKTHGIGRHDPYVYTYIYAFYLVFYRYMVIPVSWSSFYPAYIILHTVYRRVGISFVMNTYIYFSPMQHIRSEEFILSKNVVTIFGWRSIREKWSSCSSETHSKEKYFDIKATLVTFNRDNFIYIPSWIKIIFNKQQFCFNIKKINFIMQEKWQ